MDKMIRLIFFTCIVFALALSIDVPLYQSLPPTPHLPNGGRQGRYVTSDGSRLWYRMYPGQPNRPLITFLHGGYTNSNYWGLQITALRGHFPILVIDSRGHGRSVDNTSNPITYSIMADDVVSILDHLGHNRTHIVGWSDGGIIGLDIAMRYPLYLQGLFCFGCSYSYENVNATIMSSPTFVKCMPRVQEEYSHLNPQPQNWKEFKDKMESLWSKLPSWNEKDLKDIPDKNEGKEIWVVDGAEEEAINLSTPKEMSEWVIISSSSHREC